MKGGFGATYDTRENPPFPPKKQAWCRETERDGEREIRHGKYYIFMQAPNNHNRAGESRCYTPVEEPCTSCPSSMRTFLSFPSLCFLRKARRQPYTKGTAPQKATTISFRPILSIKVCHTARAEGKFVDTASGTGNNKLFPQKNEEKKDLLAIYLFFEGQELRAQGNSLLVFEICARRAIQGLYWATRGGGCR